MPKAKKDPHKTPHRTGLKKKGKRGAAKPKAPTEKLTKIDIFVREYLIDFNGRRAAIAAGYSAQSARYQARDLLAREDVQAKVQKAMRERAERTEIQADDVLRRLHAIATADPRELIEHRRGCCRYCYGKDHRYQRTAAELQRHRDEVQAKLLKDERKDPALIAELMEEFDTEGGIGWDPRKDPSDDCPECFGEGVARTYVHDTRDLSPGALLLYAGVEETKETLKVRMHSQPDMLVKVGEHLGLFRKKLELTGKDGGPVQTHDATLAELLGQVEGADTGAGRAKGRT